MDVNSVNVNVNVNVNYSTGASSNTAANNNVNSSTAEENTNAAVVAETQEKEKDTYESSGEKVYKPDYTKIKEMIAESDAKVESFRKLVEGLFNKQAKKDGIANGTLGGSNEWKGTKWENDVMIDIDEETRAAAQKEIEEGGYYSVDETAKRLLDFAVALSGGDPSRIETLKGAVEKGFKKVEEMWGDELPQISQDTYDAVMKGFDEWEEAGDSSAISLLNQND